MQWIFETLIFLIRYSLNQEQEALFNHCSLSISMWIRLSNWTNMILKLTILLAVFYCFTNFASSRSIDSRRVYHAISSGKGLYSPTDKLTILVESNFKEHVIGKSNAWLVEFYNSWCGHCIQFSPIYREFAASVARKLK